MAKQILSLISAVFLLGTTHVAVAQSDSPPSTPTDLSSARYDGAGVELFWGRSTDDVGVQGYEVTFNGQIVGVFDATSYYDASQNTTTAFTFTVTAIDSAGQRSDTAMSVSSRPDDMPPATEPAATIPPPANLTATVYSSTAAELFWSRSDIPQLQYEIVFEGGVVAITDGTSFFTGELTADQNFTFDVIAIDGSGARSEPSTVSLSTNAGEGDSTPSTTPAPVPGENLAAIAPADLRITVYSGTAAELFWAPPIGIIALIQSNEIRRNGVLIATLPGGGVRSYFDNTREPGTSYSYVVTAVSADGTGSATVSDPTSPTTTLPAADPLVDVPEDVLAMADLMLEIVNGDALAKTTLIIDQLSDPDARAALGFTDTSEIIANSSGTDLNVFDCPNGGQLLDSERENDNEFIEFEAIDCGVGSVVFSFLSQSELSADPDNDFNLRNINARNIVLNDPLDGSVMFIDRLFVFTDGARP